MHRDIKNDDIISTFMEQKNAEANPLNRRVVLNGSQKWGASSIGAVSHKGLR